MTINVINEPMTDKVDAKPQTKDSGIVDAAQLSKIVAAAVAEALKAAIPAAAVGITQAQQLATEKSREAQIREVMRRTKRCAICGQPETACGGPWKKDELGNDVVRLNKDGSPDYDIELNHLRAYVGPQDTNLFRWFQGFIVNGVRYLSDHPGHRIWIPRKSDILTGVSHWEQNEKDLMQKRTAEGMGAGSIGPAGQVMNRGHANAIGWR